MEESTIANFQIITNEISLKNNKLPDGNFSIAPRYTRSIGMIDDNTGFMELILEITNTEEHPFPLEIRVSLTGVFELSQFPEDQREYFLKITAVQIIFPYVRNIVSTLTSSALMPPIILPIIDVKRLFSDQSN
ncbi:MAG: protein-export chaperone SecB [Clostridia bacterium]|nr:protein-export chaperone SecB [Clostridia bacterium]